MNARALTAAALLPPLGAHLAGASARDVQIACVLTALGFVPGVAFALYLVFSNRGATA